MDNPKEIVREGYNKLSTYYRKHFNDSHENNYPKWINQLKTLLSEDSVILELGCGDGIPVAQLLATEYGYMGVDISAVQIESAKKNVVNGIFEVADMTTLHYPNSTFDSVIALYSIIHIPLDEQKELLCSIYNWLKPSGYFLCTLGVNAWTGIEENWIDSYTKMYWSHTSLKQYETWFTNLGFSLIKKELVPENDTSVHSLLLLRKV